MEKRLFWMAYKCKILSIMLHKKLYSFFIIAILVIMQSCEKPGITVELNYATPREDSLVILVNFKNHSYKPLFLICKANQIEVEQEISILENYHGTAEEEFEYLQNKSQAFIDMNNERSNMKDTFYLTLPKVNKQFQENYLGDKVDIYDRINNLEEAYYVLRRTKLAPEPPNVNDIAEYFYTDIDVYNLVRQKNIDDHQTFFYEEVVILKPNQIKTFSINASYLLLQKATYLLSFDFKTNDTIFSTESKVLQELGFKRYKGHIMSNIIEVKSVGNAFDRELLP